MWSICEFKVSDKKGTTATGETFEKAKSANFRNYPDPGVFGEQTSRINNIELLAAGCICIFSERPIKKLSLVEQKCR